MRKVLCLVISLALLLLCGCSSNPTEDFSSVVEVIIEDDEFETVGDNDMTSAITSSVQSEDSTPTSDDSSKTGAVETPESSSVEDTAIENVFKLSDASVLGNIKLNGRCQKTAEGIGLNFSGSAIEFNIDGGGAVIEVTAGSNVYFSIFIDGNLAEERKLLQNGTGYIVLARNLPSGSHNIKFVREGEARPKSTATVLNIQLDEGNKMLPQSNDKALLIECLGDSITSGYGNIVENNTPNASSLANQNSLKAYPYLVASRLGLDYRIVSMSGIALKLRTGYPTFYDFYSAENYHLDATQKYTSSNPQDVDIVMVNLGTNDVAAKLLNYNDATSVAEYAQLYTDLITKIGYRKDAKIVFVSGGMDCHYQVDSYKGAKTKLAAAGYNSVYLYDAPTCNLGGDSHPSADEHQQIAEGLVNFFKENNIA